MRIVALVKQIPVFEELDLGPDGRLRRAGLPLEMSAYDRRAVAQGVALARDTGGSCTVVTLGPPSAGDVLREAVAYGADAGVLVTDPAFAGSDTLATARALAAALDRLERAGGPFDLVLVGRNSVDAETGQVGPQLAQLLDRPFATGVKALAVAPAGEGDAELAATVGLEHDDTWVEATVALPAVLSTAERLIDPCKIKDPAVWAAVDPGRLTTLAAADLGPGPWGQAGSPTWVGEIRAEAVDRAGRVLDGTLDDQVAEAARLLADRGALTAGGHPREPDDPMPPGRPSATRVVGVVIEADRARPSRELLSLAARLSAGLARHGADGARVVAVGTAAAVGDPEALAAWGADEVVAVEPSSGSPDDLVEEDVATGLVAWAGGAAPWAVLAPGTAWGREVAARAAAALGAGLTGDAVGLGVAPGPPEGAGGPGGEGVDPDGPRLVAWKPAFGGGLLAAVHCRSPVQLATVRPGVAHPYRPRPRPAGPVPVATVVVPPRRRVAVTVRRREDDVADLLRAEVVVGVGQGVPPGAYGELDEFLALLGAHLGATRKVTDQGWLPHARQIGITGASIAPRLFVSLGASGKFNHMVGVRAAGTILAVNPDAAAPVFAVSDIGIVGDWRTVVPRLVRALRSSAGAALPGGAEEQASLRKTDDER